MKVSLDIIGRQKGIRELVYPIRHQVFEVEMGFPSEDGLVLCELDALSNHYVLLSADTREPIGVVSIADITGIDPLLEKWKIDPSLKVVKPHKLAILQEFRNRIDLRSLLVPIKREIEGYDYATVHVTQPSDNSDYTRHLDWADEYEACFGFKQIGLDQKPSGAKMVIMGRSIH